MLQPDGRTGLGDNFLSGSLARTSQCRSAAYPIITIIESAAKSAQQYAISNIVAMKCADQVLYHYWKKQTRVNNGI